MVGAGSLAGQGEQRIRLIYSEQAMVGSGSLAGQGEQKDKAYL